MSEDAKASENDAQVLTPEQVLAQEKLNESVTIDLQSKEDAEANMGNFLPLQEDVFYKFTVEKVEVRERPVYGDPSKMEKAIMIQFSVDGRLDGEPVKDIEGAVQENGTRKFWEWLSTTSTGFTTAGKPSKTRACVCALMGKNVEDEFKGIKTADLENKSCKAMLEIGQKKDGTKINKVLKYSSTE